MVDAHKFSRNYEVHRKLASLLSTRIGILPSNTVIVPVPTIPSHVRRRGYDHTRLIARELARLQHLSVECALGRLTASVQVGSGKKQRRLQAEKAFMVSKRPNESKIYLIVDDITTTGATLRSSSRVLVEAGAQEVWVAVIARQPLD